jgi:hypothetical protein
LETPVISLNYIREKFNYLAGDRFSFEWVDLTVSYGESNILSLLLAKSPSSFHADLINLTGAFQTDQSLSKGSIENNFSDATMRDLQKHVLLNYHDGKNGALNSISTLSPYQEGKRLQDLYSQFIRPEKVKGKNRDWLEAYNYSMNPIQQAVNLAYCLYPEDSLVIISIGSQMKQLSSKITTELEHLQMREQLRGDKKAHYFRLSPPYEPDQSFEENNAGVETFLDKELHSVDRLFRLMEIRAGRLL